MTESGSSSYYGVLEIEEVSSAPVQPYAMERLIKPQSYDCCNVGH